MLCVHAAPIQVDSANKPTNDFEAVFYELDRLSPEGIWLKPIVRIEIGNWSDGINRDQVRSFRSGLLIQETGDSITIWNRNLESVQFAKSPCEEADVPYAISLTTVSLADQVQHFNSVVEQEDPIGTMSFRRSTFESFEAMFWARVAHARDQFVLRDALVTTARARLDRTPLAYLVDEFFPLQKHWYIMRDWEQSIVSHVTILAKLDEYVQLFPKSLVFKEATDFRDQLRSLIAEKAKHTANARERTQEEVIGDLIFRLSEIDYWGLISLRSPSSRLGSVENPHDKEPILQIYRMGFDARSAIDRSDGGQKADQNQCVASALSVQSRDVEDRRLRRDYSPLAIRKIWGVTRTFN